MTGSPFIRLALFGVLLAGVFTAALLAGGATGADRPVAEKAPAMAEHAAPAPVRGLAVAEDGVRLQLLRRAPLAFRIDGARGFEVAHEKRMHLIVVRRDGRGFRHLHPVREGDVWTAAGGLDEPGVYRVFADFRTGGRAVTLATDVAVDGPARYRPFPAPSQVARAGGYEVRRDGLAFTVTRGGRLVRTEPYLGAGGHLVALREGDLAFLHTHPAEDGGTRFEAEFPSAGRYRLYFQFQVAGRVHTAEFTHDA